ncbi:hypothetical protein [Nocardia farcinica]|uniref:hypothetical protein n=1 Tax=Nocardia farcinica TaxID=37329 RepID=UPI0024565DBD|nr:hypothetical protein [Nocardia farcinica]
MPGWTAGLPWPARLRTGALARGSVNNTEISRAAQPLDLIANRRSGWVNTNRHPQGEAITQKNTYSVEIQPTVSGAVGIVTGPAFTVEAEAHDLAQAERRAIRRAVANAVSYNERNHYAVTNSEIPERSEHSHD